MTEELNQKAEEYATENYEQCIYDDVRGWENDFRARKEAYIAGATENGIQWHDLRKDPNDLPKLDKTDLSDYVMTDRGVSYYNGRLNKWYIQTDYVLTDCVIAWCEIPTFKE